MLKLEGWGGNKVDQIYGTQMQSVWKKKLIKIKQTICYLAGHLYFDTWRYDSLELKDNRLRV